VAKQAVGETGDSFTLLVPKYGKMEKMEVKNGKRTAALLSLI
jgi:hypothetical protein